MLNLHSDVINDLEAMVDGIPFGASSWGDVVTAIGAALPGSFVAIQNANFRTSQLNSFHSCNIAQEFLDSYRDHFAALNPWEGYWFKVPAGKVAVSEEVAPASLFRNTEFYNDWLIPQNNLAAAAGLKMAAEDGETIRLLMHYPLKQSPAYDIAAVQLMERLRGSLNRAMFLLRSMREAAEVAACQAALVARGSRAAFIVGAGCVLEDANHAAETLFRSGAAVKVTGTQIRLQQPSAQVQFADAVMRLCRGQAIDLACLPLETGDGRWLVSLAAIGSGASGTLSGLLPFRRKVFVSMAPLSAQQDATADHVTLRRLFGLSRAESVMCQHLLRGDTLAEASEALGIAKETARSRLKSIFARTGVARQADLILLLSRIVQ